ncbi:MAG: transglutaminase domain-containing protein [Ignavibacteriae bacterium]|nr:transglutaminase domain-containing protein [Ignavibacteriota bacterium]
MMSLVFFVAVPLFSQQAVVEQASRLEEQGKFTDAANLLSEALGGAGVDSELRKALEFERDRLSRIRADYPLSEERLFEILTKSVKDLTLDEFEQWVAEGRFDAREIDGSTYYMGSSRSNLFFRHPELASRRINAPDWTEFEQNTLLTVRSIKKAAQEQQTTYVLPKRFSATMTVTAKAGTVPAGEIVKAWLPIPRSFPHQREFEVIFSSPVAKEVANEESPIRTAYFEQLAQRDKPTVFSIEYGYSGYGVWFDMKPEDVQLYEKSDPAVVEFTKESHHVVFTEKIKNLSAKLAGGEANPAVKARIFYNWITENIKYSYALEYSTIRNISDYCLTKGYGDCGQAALLFITLCRYNGIPARWQSGWLTMPGGKTIHDWTEVYIQPYGWVPVDPYMGVFAMQYFSAPVETRKEIRDFYFGGLDQYRMAANSDHNQELVPPKQSMRSDNVDFQRGELEFGTTNIYFDKYSYRLEVKERKKTP